MFMSKNNQNDALTTEEIKEIKQYVRFCLLHMDVNVEKTPNGFFIDVVNKDERLELDGFFMGDSNE